MEGFPTTFPPPYGVVCAPAAGPIPTPGSVCWPRREARFVTPHGVNYLELCKAILGQAWPAPAARTRDCGVQVNAKVDKTVQCSLGPKTLLGSGERGEEEEDRDEDCPGGSSYKTPSVSQLRFFIRPVSIYSPVLERGFHMELAEKEARDEEKEHEQEGSKHPEQVHKATVHRANRGSNLQFLDQRYGFFHCKKCNIRWESAYVWCISGTNKVKSPNEDTKSLHTPVQMQGSCNMQKKSVLQAALPEVSGGLQPLQSGVHHMQGLLRDVLQLREEAETHQHDQASPTGSVLPMPGHQALLRRHLQLQIHRLML
ncbi:zygote arrest protein 2.L isoform X2 [Syngnathus scovelli]|uniref:zygote arrest protein 2.L isoform X2 n=1 Tax=Syngnathus scovelli TaxID=161590 RepID=UPI002110013D|nr:zygote arrest protein 1 isoform X2 [Syngnathus scovelli]